jgi:GTP-binding protein
MELLKARYLSSSATFEDLPASDTSEFCIFGRSNVGKSSFLNHVFGDTTLARVSKAPGRTRLANSYSVSDGVIWIDLPGYGYAKAGGAEKERWARLIGDYCARRSNLRGIIWLLDVRHPGTAQDKKAAAWLAEAGIPVLPVLTKCDTVSRNEASKNLRRYMQEFGFPALVRPVLYSIRDEAARIRFIAAYGPWREAAIKETACSALSSS